MKLKQIMSSASSKQKAAPTLRVGYLNRSVRFNRPTVEQLGLLKSLGMHEAAGFFIGEKIIDGRYWAILTDRIL